MARAEYNIGAATNDGTDGILWNFNANVHQIPASLMSGAAAGWLRYIAFGNSFSHRRLPNLVKRITLRASAGAEAGSGTGPDLSAAWEKSVKAVTIQVNGVDYVFPGPDAPTGIIGRDRSEPYRWAVEGVQTLVTAYRALNANVRAGTKLILDDGAAVDKKQGVHLGGAIAKKLYFGGREYSKLYVGGNLIFG